MKISLKGIKTISLFLGVLSLGLLLLSRPVQAEERTLECASPPYEILSDTTIRGVYRDRSNSEVPIDEASSLAEIDAPSELVVKFRMQTPSNFGPGDTIRGVFANGASSGDNFYNIAYNREGNQQVSGALSFSFLPIAFSREGDVYTGTVSIPLDDLGDRPFDEYFILMQPTANGDICSQFRVDFDFDLQVEDSAGDVQPGSVAGACGDLSGSLFQTHFTCTRSAGGTTGRIDASFNQGGGCLNTSDVIYSRNQASCRDYFGNSNPIPVPDNVFNVCIPCVNDLDDETNDVAEQLLDIRYGELCNVDGIPEGVQLDCDQNTFGAVCRPDYLNRLRCLYPEDSQLSGQNCTGAQKECKEIARDSGVFGAFYCVGTDILPADANQEGFCSQLSCQLDTQAIVRSNTCATNLGLGQDTEGRPNAFCVGGPEGVGSCVNEDQLKSLLANSEYIEYLDNNGVDIDDVVNGLEGVDVEIDREDIGNQNPDGGGTTRPDTPSQSNAFGARRCPQNDPVEKENCELCINLGGIWTALGCIGTTPQAVFGALIRIALGTLGGVALIRLIILGFQYQSGQEEKIKEARNGVFSTLGAILLVLFSVLILQIIGTNILDIVPEGFFIATP